MRLNRLRRRTHCLPTRLLFGIALAVACGWFAPERSTAAPPVLKSIFPLGGRPGETVTLQLRGDHLQQASALHFSRPELTAEPLDDNRFQVTIPADTPRAPVELRVETPEGLSAPRRFLVDDLPRHEEQEDDGNDEPSAAQPVEFPGVVDGQLDKAADMDWYEFTAEAGLAVTIVCRSATLDGSVAPSLRLLDAAGRQLAVSAAHQQEPLLHFQPTSTGTYRVRVCDAAYRKDDFSHYRLQLWKGPVVTAVFPHTLVPDAPAEVTLHGWALDETLGGKADSADASRATGESRWKLDLEVPSEGEPDGGGNLAPAGWWSDGFRFQPPDARGDVRLELTAEPTATDEQMARSAPSDVPLLELPARVAGRFLTPGEVDWYRIQAAKDDSLEIDAWGERLGQPMDLDVAVHSTDGKPLATLPDKPAVKGMPAGLELASLDAFGTWKAPADGEYLLAVRDLYGGSLHGPDRRYTLTVGPPRPAFHVAVLPSLDKPTSLSAAPGAQATATVVVVREGGFEGPVTVRADTLPAGVQVEPLTLDKQDVQKPLQITVAQDASPGFHSPRLVAEAQVGSETVRKAVQPLSVVRSATPPAIRRTADLPLLVPAPEPSAPKP